MNTMLAGHCNLLDDFGHSNFESMELLLDDLNEMWMFHQTRETLCLMPFFSQNTIASDRGQVSDDSALVDLLDTQDLEGVSYFLDIDAVVEELASHQCGLACYHM
ncbi:hypothetical protein ACROYT_G015188 [Oculina patagonica]